VTAQLQLLICGFFGSLNGSLVKDQKAPPPLTGEVWGEGDGGEEDSYENLEEIIEHLTVSYMREDRYGQEIKEKEEKREKEKKDREEKNRNRNCRGKQC